MSGMSMQLNKLLYNSDRITWLYFNGIKLATVSDDTNSYLALWINDDKYQTTFVFLPLTDDLVNKVIDIHTAFKIAPFMYLSTYIDEYDVDVVTKITGLTDDQLPLPGVYYGL
jgi:hypothetical protein